MTATAPTLPALPHWESTPPDLAAAVREIKSALRARIAASGRTVEEVFAVVERRVAARGAGVAAGEERGGAGWPGVGYAAGEAGALPPPAPGEGRRPRRPGG